MNEPTFSVPLKCPSCAREGLHSLSTAASAAALLKGSRLRLTCRHCPTRWSATDIEREQIRQYLAL